MSLNKIYKTFEKLKGIWALVDSQLYHGNKMLMETLLGTLWSWIWWSGTWGLWAYFLSFKSAFWMLPLNCSPFSSQWSMNRLTKRKLTTVSNVFIDCTFHPWNPQRKDTMINDLYFLNLVDGLPIHWLFWGLGKLNLPPSIIALIWGYCVKKMDAVRNCLEITVSCLF